MTVIFDEVTIIPNQKALEAYNLVSLDGGSSIIIPNQKALEAYN